MGSWPRIGVVGTHESARTLACHGKRGTACLRSAIVSFQRARWPWRFPVESTHFEPGPASRGGAGGVDLGVQSLAVPSTGEVLATLQHLERHSAHYAACSAKPAGRTGPDKPTRQKASNRWCQTPGCIARLHIQGATARDGLGKLSPRLVGAHEAIVLEALHLAGMTTNRKLAGHVAGVGMGKL